MDPSQSWAVEIVRRSFVAGITRLVDSQVLTRRYYEFREDEDPVYGALLEGLGDEQLAKAFVGYWTVGQTMASQSRFWLDHAIAEILLERFKRDGRTDVKIYPGWMLSAGYLDKRVSLAELGEEKREAVVGAKAWTVRMARDCLERIDVAVGNHERKHSPAENHRGDVSEITLTDRAEDRAELSSAIEHLAGDQVQRVNISCNLLVVEPDRPGTEAHAWALRFINPKVFAQHAVRKQERTNILRLYAYLVQEKILRDPKQIRVHVAEIVPRNPVRFESLRTPAYFSDLTYMRCADLWSFFGVPFAAASEGMKQAGRELGERLREGLKGLLPGRHRDSPSSDAP